MIQKTMKALRLQIGIFGRTNVGKSSFLNLVAGQDVAITSEEAGTTTDVVEKAMELLPLGPVLWLDTAGVDDHSALSDLRLEKTKKIFDRCDVAILVLEADIWTQDEENIIAELSARKTPVICVINKTDLRHPGNSYLESLKARSLPVILASSISNYEKRDETLQALKKIMVELCPEDFLNPPPLIGDLVPRSGLTVMVVPIDLEAPKGRIKPLQSQTIREALDHQTGVLVVKENEYKTFLKKLTALPDLVVCDSHVVDQVTAETPASVPCTTFSILFTRFKGDLDEMVRGLTVISELKNGDRILIAEACTHHAIQDDIGRVKIPNWLKKHTGADLDIRVSSGCDYPEDVRDYKLIVHCGSCMLNRRAMLSRIEAAKTAKVAITNYGVCISYLQGVLERALKPFPSALETFEREVKPILSRKKATKTETVEEWIQNRIKPEEIFKYMDSGKSFIPDEEIVLKLSQNKNPDKIRVREIIAKSLEIKNLTPDETAVLIHVTDPELIEEMKAAALKIKKKVYDNRIVTFAPLYLGNACVNNCVYCGFRRDNHLMERSVLTMDEIGKEVEVLAGRIGHKRLVVVYGEHPDMDIDYMVKSIKTIYDVKIPVRHGIGNIRRVNVNAPPLSIDELKKLNGAGLGTYQVFQETYHRPTYEKLHPKGTIKGDYLWRLYVMHRALEAGIDDVGVGALFGLYDWRYEVMALIYHAAQLESKFGIGPHTVSFPRLEPAFNTPFTKSSRYQVSDHDFKKIILLIRLALPYVGMIITARESKEMRREAIHLGITQTDASTKIGVGSYGKSAAGQEGEKQQFLLGDTRSLEEVISEFTDMGFITSFCTAGYRCGRTGKCIMDLLRSGKEGKFCKLNAVLTFREWVDDFTSSATKERAEKVLEKELSEIKEQMPQIYPKFRAAYERVKNGERDIYF